MKFENWNGALLVNKPQGISSFGVIEALQKSLRAVHGLKRSELPKIGHGGTLDPFATGLLVVCTGRALKLARYFLGSQKEYIGRVRFGETTVPGDPTAPISERSDQIPSSIEELQAMATKLTAQPYLQVPPMHSAKKKNGKPLYELARQGIEVERTPKLCHLDRFEILQYEPPHALIRVQCSSGTYIRTLAQDFGRILGTVAMLETLERTGSGRFRLEDALPLERITQPDSALDWPSLDCWIPFDRLLDDYSRADATFEEAQALIHGRQSALFSILERVQPAASSKRDQDTLVIYNNDRIVAIAKRERDLWGLERVFA